MKKTVNKTYIFGSKTPATIKAVNGKLFKIVSHPDWSYGPSYWQIRITRLQQSARKKHRIVTNKSRTRWSSFVNEFQNWIQLNSDQIIRSSIEFDPISVKPSCELSPAAAGSSSVGNIMTKINYCPTFHTRELIVVLQSATIPAVSYLLGRWSPVEERSLLFSIASTGELNLVPSDADVHIGSTGCNNWIHELIIKLTYGLMLQWSSVFCLIGTFIWRISEAKRLIIWPNKKRIRLALEAMKQTAE